MSALIVLKNLVDNNDKSGFGAYIPFRYASTSSSITIKVVNTVDVLTPTSYEFEVRTYETMS